MATMPLAHKRGALTMHGNDSGLGQFGGPELRMVAKPRLAIRGPGATEDRETVEEYYEEREIDNEYSERCAQGNDGVQ
eukprot:6129824-Amphidinium_carterae.1